MLTKCLTDTFCSVFKNLDTYNPDYPFKPWLRKVCISCCLKHQKKYLDDHVVNYDIKEIDYLYTEDKELEINLEPNQALKLLNQLPTQYRIVLNLYVFEGLKAL